ncbi:MAG: hypothetical protein AAFY78_08000 [Cyanobacteria bacterium J06648_16]
MRLSEFDRNTLVVIVSSHDSLSESDVNRVIDQVESARDSALQKAERLEHQVQSRINDLKLQAQKQVDFDLMGPHVLDVLLLSGLLLLVIRPLGAQLSLLGGLQPMPTRWLTGWFGIRGLGSLYYLTYALSQGRENPLADRLTWIGYLTIAVSICLHGVTASPLMNWYRARKQSHSAI